MKNNLFLIIGILLLLYFIWVMFSKDQPLFWGVALEGDQFDRESLEKINHDINLKAQLIEFYLQWPTPLPSNSLKAIWEMQAVPCITWEPLNVRWEEIQSYEDYIFTFAKAVKAFSFPLIIRFAHEMNLERYHWGTQREDYGPQSPEIYKKMFVYVVDKFKQEGVENVLWAFCPNAESIPNTPWNKASAYYPGDLYVDILGMDGYNWGTSQTIEKNLWKSEWRSFSNLFSPIFQELKQLNSNLPIFVFETSSVDKGGDRKKWIDEAFKTCKQWEINALIWFYVDKEENWKIKNIETTLISSDENSQEWIQDKFETKEQL